MRRGRHIAGLLGVGLVAAASVASAQSVPTARDQVARPGGTVPGLPALALVEVADGFADPVGVASLIGQRHIYEGTATDVGLFEAVLRGPSARCNRSATA